MDDRTGEIGGVSPAPRPADVASPEAAVLALYDVISGPADLEREWPRLRALSDPRVRVVIGRWLDDPDGGTDVVHEWDLEAFIPEGLDAGGRR